MSPLASAMLGDQQRMLPLASMVAANAGPAPSIDAASAPTPADAWSQNASAVQAWLAQQQAQSARMGLWNDQTGLPTQAGVMDAARQYANGMQPATIKAFHGSPHDFSAFDMSKIGTGEGAQAYGHGLYFAGNEGVAQGYRDALTAPKANPEYVAAQNEFNRAYDAVGDAGSDAEFKQALAVRDALRARLKEIPPVLPNDTPGRMYEVNLNVEPGQLLDWDKPLSQQSPQVQALAQNHGVPNALPDIGKPSLTATVPPTGRDAYEYAAGRLGDSGLAAQQMRDAGIPGIQYLDAGSRAAGDGTRNYVMFDPNLIDIVRKYGLAGAMLGAPAAAPFMPSQAPQQ